MHVGRMSGPFTDARLSRPLFGQIKMSDDKASLFSEPDSEEIRKNLIDDGYAIARGAVNSNVIHEIQEFWLRAFEEQASLAPMIWGPYLGEPNKIHFHQSEDNCLYRSYDFLWNDPIDPLSREIALAISRFRNKVTELGDFTGELLQPDRYGIYMTVSHYPVGSGWLRDHEDDADGRRHWHYILPLTFRGADYDGGGLHLTDRKGNYVDVDGQLGPGDVLFFDGGLTHGVSSIRGDKALSRGRMQMFSIPTFLDLPAASDRFVESISLGRFIKGKLRPAKQFIQGKSGFSKYRRTPK